MGFEEGKESRMIKKSRIVGQLLVIISLFEIFFIGARFSLAFYQWNPRPQLAAKAGLGLFSILWLAAAAVYVYTLLRGKRLNISTLKQHRYDCIGVVLLLAIHFALRIRMIPVLPMDDGIDYFSALDAIVWNPEILMDHFFSGGRLSGHIAHGYIFLSIMGEFAFPGEAVGYQVVQMLMGMAAACCLYGILRRLLPGAKAGAVWIGAFLVSVQPMFLGTSTMCNLEYTIIVLFIYAFYCYLGKSYILMAFWLLLLGTTKETGMMMSLVFAGSVFLAWLIGCIRSSGVKGLIKRFNYRWGIAAAVIVAALAGLAYVILNMPVWGNARLIEVLNFGGDGRMTFTFNAQHILMKASQLYVLNFSWIWVIFDIVGIAAYIFDRRVRACSRLEFKPLLVLLISYAVYTFFLCFYQEAKQPRYNMLSDVLFALLSVLLFFKLFERCHVQCGILSVLSLVMLAEAYVTIDPVSLSIYTNVNTNRNPMVFTATFKSEMGEMESNAGDFAYYNYQYNFVDRALNKILAGFNWEGSVRILSASANVESQLYFDKWRWDTKYLRRGYDTKGDQYRFKYIRRDNVFEMLGGTDWPDNAILIESPWCVSGYLDAAVEQLSEYYEIDGPYEADEGLAGTVIYYYIRRR